MMPVDMLLSESYSPLRTAGWTLIQVDALLFDAVCDFACVSSKCSLLI